MYSEDERVERLAGAVGAWDEARCDTTKADPPAVAPSGVTKAWQDAAKRKKKVKMDFKDIIMVVLQYCNAKNAFGCDSWLPC